MDPRWKVLSGMLQCGQGLWRSSGRCLDGLGDQVQCKGKLMVAEGNWQVDVPQDLARKFLFFGLLFRVVKER